MAFRRQGRDPQHAHHPVVTRCIAGLIVVCVALVTVQLQAMPTASACDLIPLFQLDADYLTADDFGQPDSQLAQDFDTFWETDTGVVIVGGHVIETVYTLEPVDDWTRGSVSTVVQSWGERPDDLGPFLHPTTDESTVTTTNGGCVEPTNGPQLGSLQVVLVTDLGEESWRFDFNYDGLEDAVATLTAAFGEPETLGRDAQAEELLIARLVNARSGSGTGIAIVLGLILVIGGGLAYQYRKKKPFWQSAEGRE